MHRYFVHCVRGMRWTSQRTSQNHPHLLCLNPDNDNLDDELLRVDDLSSRSTSAGNCGENFAIAGSCDLNHPVNKAIEEEASEEHTAKKKVSPKQKRDQWTRWPLLLDDLPIPEWDLENEVAL
jgi:hypothetical protein